MGCRRTRPRSRRARVPPYRTRSSSRAARRPCTPPAARRPTTERSRRASRTPRGAAGAAVASTTSRSASRQYCKTSTAPDGPSYASATIAGSIACSAASASWNESQIARCVAAIGVAEPSVVVVAPGRRVRDAAALDVLHHEARATDGARPSSIASTAGTGAPAGRRAATTLGSRHGSSRYTMLGSRGALSTIRCQPRRRSRRRAARLRWRIPRPSVRP